MLKQKAIVTNVFNKSVEVEYEVNSTCSSCSSQDSCGVGTVAKAFNGKTKKISVETSLILSKGQHVFIETLESNVLMTSAVTYLLPLVGLLISSVIGQKLLVEQAGLASYYAIFLGLLGGFLAQRLGRYWLKIKSVSQPDIVIVPTQS